jgi:hypothetical protein
MVSITALSAVGAAFSVGAVGVCAKAPELKLTTPTSAAAAISDPAFSDPSDRFPRPIAVSLFWAFDHVAGLLQMAIIAGQRVLRKSMSADAIREWAPIAKDE